MPHRHDLADPHRLQALSLSGLMDSLPEDSFDRITRIAAQVLSVPVSLLSLVDDKRQFFKSTRGLPEALAELRTTPLTHSFCQHVVMEGAPLAVEDSLYDELVKDNKAVSELGVRAYVGVPVFSATGEPLGSLCAIDMKPRIWDDNDIAILRDLADVVMTEINLRAEIMKRKENEVRLDLLSREMIHRTKNVFSLTSGIVALSAQDGASKDFAAKVSQRLQALSNAQEYVYTPASLDDRNLSGLISTLLSAYPADRIAVEPSLIPVGENAATAFGFAIHELATNAVKYGALSSPGGKIGISVAQEGDQIVVHWRESGGPKVNGEPTAYGFGNRMIGRSVKSYLEGAVQYDWHADGLLVEISASKARIAA